MEIHTLKNGRMLRNGQMVFDATVSLGETGTFNTMEERDNFVKERTEYLNGLAEKKEVVLEAVEDKKKVKK